MELLLVVAILAIVAAVAAPQFFRTSEVAMEDSRVAQLKANHAAIRAAINMAVWDDHNNPNLAVNSKLTGGNAKDGSAANNNSYVRKLIERGFLQESAAYFENEKGEKIFFRIENSATTDQNPYDSTIAKADRIASAPIFMEQSKLFQICVKNSVAKNNIDQRLRDGDTWLTIWNSVKTLAPAP